MLTDDIERLRAELDEYRAAADTLARENKRLRDGQVEPVA
jgi:cell division protein FtsB